MSDESMHADHEDALALYLQELLSGDDGAVKPAAPEKGVALSCGRVEADDERYLVFEVGDLNVALPAARISKELPFGGTLDGAENESVRVLTLPDGRVMPVIDLARLILPAALPTARGPLSQRSRALLVLDDGQWAVALGAEARLEALDVDKVVWRGSSARRMWLAGALAEHRLVLLDPDGLVGMLP